MRGPRARAALLVLALIISASAVAVAQNTQQQGGKGAPQRKQQQQQQKKQPQQRRQQELGERNGGGGGVGGGGGGGSSPAPAKNAQGANNKPKNAAPPKNAPPKNAPPKNATPAPKNAPAPQAPKNAQPAKNATPAPKNAPAPPAPKNAQPAKNATPALKNAPAPPQPPSGKQFPFSPPGACAAPSPFDWPARDPSRPRPSSGRPNFVVILLDDLARDDIAALHRLAPSDPKVRHVLSTPNLDRFLKESTLFDDFIVTSMCSTTRASLLTGRDARRGGVLYVNGGWDHLNVNETTFGQAFKDAGYRTSFFGKHHNGMSARYMPEDTGFEYVVSPDPYVYTDNVFKVNGGARQTSGWLEERLMDSILDYLKQRERDPSQPFLMYYPSFAVHAGWRTAERSGGGRYQRPAPEPLRAKYRAVPGLSPSTADLYAMAEFMDAQLGRLFDYVDKSPQLAGNTYIFAMGDNGAELFDNEVAWDNRIERIPSRMVGEKRRIEEGGTRNFLAVKGPGVKRGSVNPTLTHVTDIFPTLQEMAGGVSARTDGPLDGMSIANMIFGGQPTSQQNDRVVVELDVTCTADDFVPLLGKDRRTQKPQPLLDYYKGGDDGQGFKKCIGARWRDYKWLGKNDQVYLFKGGSHEEAPCAAVSDESVRSKLSSAAKSWFDSVVSSPNAFERPRYFIGMPGRSTSAVLGTGAAERTPGRVSVLPTGLVGFSQPGDSASWRVHVLTGGQYSLGIGLKANHAARFRLSMGEAAQIAQGKAPIKYEFDADPSTAAYTPDKQFSLPVTDPTKPWEMKLEMVSTSKKGSPAVRALQDVTFGVRKRLTDYVPYDFEGDEGVGQWRQNNRDKLKRLSGSANGGKRANALRSSA